MKAQASIAQEYYKLQELWAEIDADRDWRLAIWVSEYQDIDIIDKFLEIERSPLGMFDDIFFRFDTVYKGDDTAFEQSLWNEYVEWFTEKVDPSLDLIQALKNEELLRQNYFPDQGLEPTLANLWKEMLRFKSCIDGLEEDCFCIYFPPTPPDGHKLTDWFNSAVDEGVPEGIRMVTIDYAKQRKIKVKPSAKIVTLHPKLNMQEAISNDMDKDSSSHDSVGTESRFRKQIRVVMDCTLKKDHTLLEKEILKLISISNEIDNESTHIAGLLIASQACYSTGNHDKCEYYADNAVTQCEDIMKTGDPTGYAVWKAAIMLKAAVLHGRKQRREAIEIYHSLAEKAILQADAFYAMEGYRMCAYIYYELGEIDTALENALLALAAGSYMEQDMRRQSTFLLAAALALLLIKKERGSQDVEILEKQLAEWLGDDWRKLIETDDMEKIKLRRKASIFS